MALIFTLYYFNTQSVFDFKFKNCLMFSYLRTTPHYYPYVLLTMCFSGSKGQTWHWWKGWTERSEGQGTFYCPIEWFPFSFLLLCNISTEELKPILCNDYKLLPVSGEGWPRWTTWKYWETWTAGKKIRTILHTVIMFISKNENQLN